MLRRLEHRGTTLPPTMRDPRYGASVYAAHHCSALNHAWNVPQDCSCEAHKSAVTIDSWKGWPPRPHWGWWGRHGESNRYFRIMPIISIPPWTDVIYASHS